MNDSRIDEYENRARALLHALDRLTTKVDEASDEASGRTPRAIAARLFASVISAEDRQRMRARCIDFASRMGDSVQRGEALRLFAFVLGDSGRRTLRPGEVAVSVDELRAIDVLASDVAIDSLLLMGELYGDDAATGDALDVDQLLYEVQA